MHPKKWLRPDLVSPSPFLQCEPHLTPSGSGVLADPAKIDEEFSKAWLPYFCRSGQRDTSLEDFALEVDGWLPLVLAVSLPRLTGQVLPDVVQRKGAPAGSLDGWGWRELKVLPVSWFDELARILTKVEEVGVWPDGFLDAYIAMIPEADGDATPLGQRPATDSDIHLFVVDVIKSFDTVDRRICVLGSLGLPGWFRHTYFEYHAHVRWRFKLASGLGEPWTRDGGIPQGCPLSMMFIVALYLPWCRYLAAQVQPQLYADNLKCVSRDPDLFLNAARFTTGYVRLVGQEPAPSKCVLLSTSREIRRDMKEWVLSLEGNKWSVKFDVRDLGRHLDTTFRGWSSTLAARVRLVIARLL